MPGGPLPLPGSLPQELNLYPYPAESPPQAHSKAHPKAHLSWVALVIPIVTATTIPSGVGPVQGQIQHTL